MASSAPSSGPAGGSAQAAGDAPPGGESEVSIQKIQELLKAKDDTSRFVGLALLKSVLDNSPELREDEASITALWISIPSRFLDRLLRTGATQKKDAKDMLDIAVAVHHTFVVFLPDDIKRESKMFSRIPMLVNTLLYSSPETTQLTLQTLLTLTSFPEGAKELVHMEDISSLVEIAPTYPAALEVLYFTWLNSMSLPEAKATLSLKIDATIRSLVATFRGTDAITLLAFLAKLLRSLNAESLPRNPPWIKQLIAYIRNVVSSRPTAEGRAAYTNLAATLLQVYPSETPQLLFSEEIEAEKPFSYLFVNLLLVDLRSSFPSLLEKLNSPEYSEIARRLASAFDIISSFIGFLVRYMDDDNLQSSSTAHMMAPDLLLKLRKSISETMSVTIEFLRDRWDASVAGALGLHPDARAGTANTFAGSRLTLAWDSKTDAAGEDALIFAAVRSLAIWLREDDNDTLRREAAALADMLMELYRDSGARSAAQDFRPPVVVALEGITAVEEGVEAFLDQDGWDILSQDMLAVLQASSAISDEAEALRATEIVRLLLPIAEAERPGAREAWMAVVTKVAAWDVPPAEQPPAVYEFQVAVLQLVTALLANTHPG
ncbi:putative duf1941 family protein [Phaeoacremonium minimum UCRPA7]|uniref:Putative duf1941 family protein n=1 Tax=Phaeoacremonium minimum (strain UCR-PA7) TaxID=1286976 RepID=R8BUJ7_PHAM7|nr:putative duf1941 family protein [Phaeoacremonium minimum UCRPA7]EOO03041.1 putative duf1941 family protein [Phaeoacremonium minimum UCRPA7]